MAAGYFSLSQSTLYHFGFTQPAFKKHARNLYHYIIIITSK